MKGVELSQSTYDVHSVPRNVISIMLEMSRKHYKEVNNIKKEDRFYWMYKVNFV